MADFTGTYTSADGKLSVSAPFTVVDAGTPQPLGAPGNWRLVREDTFDTLDTSYWAIPRRSAVGVAGPYNTNVESAAFSKDNVKVQDGCLVLTALNTPTVPNTYNKPWSSGAVESKVNYLYGFFEARFKVPEPSKAWTAFWLTSSQGWPPEIDIAEFHFQGNNPTFNSHGTKSGANSNIAGWPTSGKYGGSADFTQFHTYGIAWSASGITLYFDGVVQPVKVTNGIPSTPMFPIFDYAVASNALPTSGTHMDIDYLRIWQ